MSGGFGFSGNTSFSGSSSLAGGGGQFGGTYTISQGGEFGRPAMESLVRPFVTIDSSPPAPAQPKRAIPGDSGEASICIGGPSRFQQQQQLENPYITNNSYSVTSSFPADDEGPENPEDTALIFRETARTVSVIRVENPEDAAQYVDVERIETIDFIGPDGLVRRFILEHA